MDAKRFAVNLGSNKGNLFFEVPFDVKEAFGKDRAPVKVSVNGHKYRSTVAVYGGRYYVPVRREHREAAEVKVGDRVDVTLEFDTEPRTVETPADLAAQLQKNPIARAAWEKLSYTHKKEHADAILGAKKAETRVRRIQKTIEMLARKKG